MLQQIFKKTLAGFNIVFALSFVFITLTAAVSPTINKFGLFQPAIAIFVVAITVVSLLIAIMNMEVSPKITRLYPLFVCLLFFICAVVQFIVARALVSKGYSWDSELVLKNAMLYAQHSSIQPSFVDYLRNNPNNVALITILGLFFKVTHHYGFTNYIWYAVLLNGLLMFVTQVFLFLTANLLFGRRFALLAGAFGFIFLSLSMFVEIPYTDTLSVLFPIAIVYCSLHILRTDRLWLKPLLVAAIGGLSYIGYQIKPTVVFTLLAIVVSFITYLIVSQKVKLKDINIPLTAATLATITVVLTITYVGFHTIIKSSHILPASFSRQSSEAKPPIFFVAMGMKQTVVGNSVDYGGYDPTITSVVDSLHTEAAKKSYAANAIHNQLSAYGPFGYLTFLGHKLKWIYSDGTFFAYGEGDNSQVQFLHHDSLSNNIRQYMYFNGAHYQAFAGILQVFWISILLLISLQSIIFITSRAAQLNIYFTALRLMVTALTVFLLFFEGRSRYLFLYVPIFILLATYTLWRTAPGPHDIKVLG